MSRTAPLPQRLPVFRAAAFCVTAGANEGDALSFAAELVLDDIYTLSRDAASEPLLLTPRSDGVFDRAVGDLQPQHLVHLDCAIALMAQDGTVIDALLLVEVDPHDNVVEVYLFPLAQLAPDIEYQLVRIDTKSAREKFARTGCASFAAGTHITLASGVQKQIEDLRVGDLVLTRDEGAQPVRWIGTSTQRATGDFAPIRISAGTLNNDHDLIVSRDHRLFIYQRSDVVGTGRAELMIKAAHLVNDHTVVQLRGGYIDTYQVLFDSHQIIYAEGIAAESMLIDSHSAPVLPRSVARAIGVGTPGHANLPFGGLDVGMALLDRPDMAEQLRIASSG